VTVTSFAVPSEKLEIGVAMRDVVVQPIDMESKIHTIKRLAFIILLDENLFFKLAFILSKKFNLNIRFSISQLHQDLISHLHLSSPGMIRKPGAC